MESRKKSEEVVAGFPREAHWPELGGDLGDKKAKAGRYTGDLQDFRGRMIH